MHQHEQAEHCFVGLVCTTARCVREDGVVIMIDLEEIDLSAAPCTNARKIRAGKKNVAKILARARSMPSWNGHWHQYVVKKHAGPEGDLSRRTVR